MDNKSDNRSSLESKVNDIIKQIEQIIESHNILNPEPFKKLINELREQIADVIAIEKDMNSIRREIVGPVTTELEKSAKLGKFSFWGFWIGLLGGILAIIALSYSVYTSAKSESLSQSANRIEQNVDKINKNITSNTNLESFVRLEGSVKQINDKLEEINKHITSKENYQTVDKNFSINSINSSLPLKNLYSYRREPYKNSSTLKKGEKFKDIHSDITLIISEIHKDNTADIIIDFPNRPSVLFGSDRSDNEMKKFDKVTSGKFWEYEGIFGKYKISIIEINFVNSTVSVEVEEI